MDNCPSTSTEQLRAEVEKWKVEAHTAWQGQEAGSQWNWELSAENDKLEAENERLRQVVDAATAYVDIQENSSRLDLLVDAGNALSKAVHEYKKVQALLGIDDGSRT